MDELSIFVDESGDFGVYSTHSPYYIVTMILHEQSKDISSEITQLNTELSNLGYTNHVVHTEPLIRREYDYQNLSPNERRSIFTKLYYFTLKCNIQYKTFVFHKKEFENIHKLKERMRREISSFIRENLTYFQKFKNVLLYYDNGQNELSQFLNTALAAELTAYNIRKVLPCNYKLFQAADLICTLELLRLKSKAGSLTRSEQLIFHSKRNLKKNYLKGILKKTFKS